MSIIILGHRGRGITSLLQSQTIEAILEGRDPENSLPALFSALLSGADGVEIDIQLAKDGVPVLAHDEALNKLVYGADKDGNDLGNISDYTANELADARFSLGPLELRHRSQDPQQPKEQKLRIPGTIKRLLGMERMNEKQEEEAIPLIEQKLGVPAEKIYKIPTLEEALTLIAQINPNYRDSFSPEKQNKGFTINIELKARGSAAAVKKQIDSFIERGLLVKEQILVSSFDFDMLAEMRVLDPDVRLGGLFQKLEALRSAGRSHAIYPDDPDGPEYQPAHYSAIKKAIEQLGLYSVHLEYGNINDRAKRIVKEKDVVLFVWTDNEPRLADRVERRNVETGTSQGVEIKITPEGREITETIKGLQSELGVPLIWCSDFPMRARRALGYYINDFRPFHNRSSIQISNGDASNDRSR